MLSSGRLGWLGLVGCLPASVSVGKAVHQPRGAREECANASGQRVQAVTATDSRQIPPHFTRRTSHRAKQHSLSPPVAERASLANASLGGALGGRKRVFRVPNVGLPKVLAAMYSASKVRYLRMSPAPGPKARIKSRRPSFFHKYEEADERHTAIKLTIIKRAHLRDVPDVIPDVGDLISRHSTMVASIREPLCGGHCQILQAWPGLTPREKSNVDVAVSFLSNLNHKQDKRATRHRPSQSGISLQPFTR